jgi:hypothetical protein
MAQRYLFADESGNFDFTEKGSRFFILATVSMDCAVGDGLLALRRELAWKGIGLDNDLHASEAPQRIRDQVFAFVQNADIRVDSTILEKRKAYPGIRPTEERFYQTAWYRHMRFVAGLVTSSDDELMVVSASIGTKKKKAAFHLAVTEAVKQSTASSHRVACWGAATDPCLQVADYCAWAIQRKWEIGDPRSYNLIRKKIKSEFDLFKTGYMTYY